MSERPVFRADEPGSVPWGPHLWALEASAGTGKTWTIERLVLAYLAGSPEHEPIAPDELVVVTFTRAASAEMSSRLRRALREAVGQRRLITEPDPLDDVRVERLARVLARVGQLRVSTIHGFAQRTLALLGEPVGSLDEAAESPELLESAVRDALAETSREQRREALRSLGATSSSAADDRRLIRAVREILDEVVRNPGGEIAPSVSVEGVEDLVAIVERAKAMLVTRRARLGIASYGDLLTRLAERLHDGRDRQRVAASIGAIVVDEFQDTDALQWEIFRSIAEEGRLRAFVAVGDPKQAIYGFRGGDVQVYREAVSESDSSVLAVNFRSTAPLIEGANLVFGAVGDFGIAEVIDSSGRLVVPAASIHYVPVRAPDDPPAPIPGAPWLFQAASATRADDVRDEVFSTLLPRYVEWVVGRETIVDASGERPMRHDDLCVLVATNAEAARVARGLQNREHPIPVSVIGGAPVTTSEAAAQWRRVLAALEEPAHPGSARAFALSWFGGEEPSRVARQYRDELGVDPDAAARWLAPHRERLLAWRAAFDEAPRAEFVARVLAESGVEARVARGPLATRRLTDLAHVAELIAARAGADLSELASLLLSSRLERGDGDASAAGEGPAARRIEGDAGALRVMTIHAAKGLEFPVVLLPFLSRNPGGGKSSPVVTYRARRDGTLVTLIDPSASGKGFASSVKMAKLRSEVRRRGYVALTRARMRTVLWSWSSTSGGDNGPLLSLSDLRRWAEEAPELFAEVAEVPGTPPTPSPARPARLEGSVARWRSEPVPARLSYSAITGHLSAPHGAVAAPEAETADSEGTPASWPAMDEEVRRTVRSSARLGRVVHRVFEDLDDPEPHPDDLVLALEKAARREALALVDSRAVADFVARAWRSSVGPLGDHAPLGTHGRAHRLVEVGFDLPLVGSDVARLLRVVRDEADDPVIAAWAAATTGSSLSLAGTLTGSIDAVLALAPRRERFLVVDYKTNQSRVEGL